MSRGKLGLVGLGVLLTLVLLAVAPSSARPNSAQDGEVDPTATRQAEEAELADLRTRVAGLATEVARLGGGEQEALTGRLGGSRTGFDDAYGPPAAFIGADQVAYDVPEVGRLTVTFEEDRAVRLVISPPRPADKPNSEADAADWSIAEAGDVATRFAPADAELGDLTRDRAADGLVTTGTSTALTTGTGTPTASGCVPTGGGSFTVSFTRPTRETVSAVTLELAPDAAIPPTPAPPSERRGGGANVFAASSLPGETTVNQVRVRGIQARFDAEAMEAPVEDGSSVAVELEIENQTEGSLEYAPGHFLLVDEDGRELSAVCGGVEPELSAGEIGPGESAEGWVSFLLPEGFEPARFEYRINGAPGIRVVFLLD